jgi:hypothetical protein
MSTADALIIGSLLGGGYRLTGYWLRLRFLRGVFRHTGDRADLRAAGEALRGPSRHRRT